MGRECGGSILLLGRGGKRKGGREGKGFSMWMVRLGMSIQGKEG